MAENFGKFLGTVKAEWITPDRKMKLLSAFTYVDPTSTNWLAPKGAIVDGASIPQILWSVVGSPFTGEYRNASVVHDTACDERSRPWQSVHQMFYFACRCGGVGEIQAKLMFAAVYHFGPRWGAQLEGFAPKMAETPENFAQLKAFVEESNPSLDKIMAVRALQ